MALPLASRFRTRALLALAPLVCAACASDRQVIAQANDAHREIEPAILDDPELVNYLAHVGARIVDSAHALSDQGYGPKSHREEDPAWMFRDARFNLVNSETLNAFTMGSGDMYVYTQLMRTCRNEDELAAVMAHEYAHVYARHVHSGVERGYLAIGGAVAGGVIGYTVADDDNRWEAAALGAVAASTAAQFLNMGFTRDDEAEADELGFEFYAHAGWDPTRFGGFFQQLADKGYDTTPEMMSDHPTLASRVQAARVRAAKLPPDAPTWRKPPVADEAHFKALQQRAAQVAQAMPADESLAAAHVLLAAVGNCLVPTEQPEQIEARQTIRSAIE